MPTVSVIIPIYNKEKYLQRAINSVLKQTYSDIELIVVDDGSTDNSSTIIKENCNKDDRIKCYSQSNKGVSSARNTGMSIAKGKYISFLDADDEWKSDFIEKMLIAIKNENVCYCGTYIYQKNEFVSKNKLSFVEGNILEDYLSGKNTPHTNCWLLKKDFLEEFSIRFAINSSWGEDMSFFSKVLLHSNKVKSCSRYLSVYYSNIEDSLSSNSISKIDADIEWTTKLVEYILSTTEDKNRLVPRSVIILESYRLPALIIYRIYLNRNILEKQEIIELMKLYNPYIHKMKFINGLRGLKLKYVYEKLKLFVKYKKR